MCSDHISLPFTSDNKMERCTYLLSPFLAPCSLPGISRAFPTSGFHDRFMQLFNLSTHLMPSLCSYSIPHVSSITQCSRELPVPWIAVTSWANRMLISSLGWDVLPELSSSVTIYLCFWALPFFLQKQKVAVLPRCRLSLRLRQFCLLLFIPQFLSDSHVLSCRKEL